MTLTLHPDTSAPAHHDFSSTLFGALGASEKQVVRFDAGLLGFPTCRRWLVVDGVRPGTAWLQSVDHEAITFMMVDPFIMFDAFAIDLSPMDLRRIGATHAANVVVLALVTLPRAPGAPATANLQGPLVIDVRARRGMQLVIEGGRWGVREPLPAGALRQQVTNTASDE